MNTSPSYNPERSGRAWLKPILILGLLSLALAACSGIALSFSPEQAVMQGVLNNPRPNAVVDATSVKALQRLEAAGKTFVIVSNQQQADGHIEDCLWLMEARRSPILGWVSGSGGGSCSGQVGGDPAPREPLSVGSGTMSGDSATDPGISQTYGKVNQDDIVKVRVTWSDGQVQEVAVVHASYAAIRAGKFNMTRVEGLNEKDEAVYQFNRATGPVKQ